MPSTTGRIRSAAEREKGMPRGDCLDCFMTLLMLETLQFT